MVAIASGVAFYVITLLGIFLTALLVYHIFNYNLFCSLSNGPKSTKMKWKDIKQLYRINPKRWNYDSSGPILWYNMNVKVRLSFFGYIALIWYSAVHARKINRDRKQDYRVASMKYILETAQQDINHLKQEAMDKVSAAVKIQGEILERTQKDA